MRNWRTPFEQNDRIAKTLDSEGRIACQSSRIDLSSVAAVFNMLHQNVRLPDSSFVPRRNLINNIHRYLAKT